MHLNHPCSSKSFWCRQYWCSVLYLSPRGSFSMFHLPHNLFTVDMLSKKGEAATLQKIFHPRQKALRTYVRHPKRTEEWNRGRGFFLKQRGWNETYRERKKVWEKRENINSEGKKVGRWREKEVKQVWDGRGMRKISVSMETHSMKIFRAAVLLLLNDFISFCY